MKCSRFLGLIVTVGLVFGCLARAGVARAEEKGNEHPWNISLEVGRIDMEGDFPTKDGFVSSLFVGYDYSDWWTFEAGLFVAPSLKAQTIKGEQNPDGTFQYVKPLEESAGVSETTGYGATFDALFHFTPWERVDPYFSLGALGIGFTDDISDKDRNQFDAGLRGGGGVIYNFNDEWSVRTDFRGVFAVISRKGTVNSSLQAGVRYVFGAHVAPDFSAAGGPKDSDADGLTDDEEMKLGTDPHHADTDKDGLSDYDEVKVYHTNPLNPDTDFDALKDGPEVFNYLTDPNVRDTDKGGVADGHEVIEDGTNPKDGSDDLQLFELNIQFDYDKAVIKAEYFKDLDIIGKVLQRDPGASARIEGHADQLKKSNKVYNEKLSERRAKACVDYLVEKAGIERSHLTAVGYGFSRPKVNPDLINGTPANRRVEVYIRKSGMPPAPATPITAVELPPATGPAK
jgi:outer membrane protein OmpA-like peptidoglycan-associated protein